MTSILLAILIIACTYLLYRQFNKLHRSICNCIDRRQIELQRFIQVYITQIKLDIVNGIHNNNSDSHTLDMINNTTDDVLWWEPNTPQEDYEEGVSFRKMVALHGKDAAHWCRHGKIMGWDSSKRRKRKQYTRKKS